MTRLASSRSVTAVIDHVSQTGPLGRELAVRLDITRSTGLRYAWRRIADEARERRSRPRCLVADPVYRAIWIDATAEVGADVVELPAGFLELRKGGAWTRVWRQWVMLDDAVTLRFALEKTIVQKRLCLAGLSIPEHLEFESSELSPAVDFLARGPAPCVLKPVASSGGGGVTSGIHTIEDLTRAKVRASRIDRRLMIERQTAGDSYRFLFLDGVLLDVVRRRPPGVTGDGRSTIEQLIAVENRRRLERRRAAVLWPLLVDLDCILTLQSAGLTVSSILPHGVRAEIKTVVSQNAPGDNETVREAVSPALVDEARKAVELTGLRLGGVDIITPELSGPLSATGGAIIEVNGTPGFSYHYEVADRANATRVAVPILRELLRQRHHPE